MLYIKLPLSHLSFSGLTCILQLHLIFISMLTIFDCIIFDKQKINEIKLKPTLFTLLLYKASIWFVVHFDYLLCVFHLINKNSCCS